MALKNWKSEGRGVDGRYHWQTIDHHYGLVVNPMAYGNNKWHVGYNYISNPNHVDLANNVSKQVALKVAKRFMRSH